MFDVDESDQETSVGCRSESIDKAIEVGHQGRRSGITGGDEYKGIDYLAAAEVVEDGGHLGLLGLAAGVAETVGVDDVEVEIGAEVGLCFVCFSGETSANLEHS